MSHAIIVLYHAIIRFIQTDLRMHLCTFAVNKADVKELLQTKRWNAKRHFTKRWFVSCDFDSRQTWGKGEISLSLSPPGASSPTALRGEPVCAQVCNTIWQKHSHGRERANRETEGWRRTMREQMWPLEVKLILIIFIMSINTVTNQVQRGNLWTSSH